MVFMLQSLIQERQQEEEERLALEALDAIAEAQCEEDGEKENSPTISTQPLGDGMDTTTSDIGEIDDDEVQPGSLPERKGCGEDIVITDLAPSSSASDSESEMEDEERIDGPSSSPEAPSTSSSSSSSAKSSGRSAAPSTQRLVDSQPLSTSSGASASSLSSQSEDKEFAVVPTKSSALSEPASASSNSTDSDIDDLFDVEPPKKKARVAEPELGKENSMNTSIIAASKSNEWECVACTFRNAKSKRKCDICGTKKPAVTSNARR
jgi:hypothetical protein